MLYGDVLLVWTDLIKHKTADQLWQQRNWSPRGSWSNGLSLNETSFLIRAISSLRYSWKGPLPNLPGCQVEGQRKAPRWPTLSSLLGARKIAGNLQKSQRWLTWERTPGKQVQIMRGIIYLEFKHMQILFSCLKIKCWIGQEWMRMKMHYCSLHKYNPSQQDKSIKYKIM